MNDTPVVTTALGAVETLKGAQNATSSVPAASETHADLLPGDDLPAFAISGDHEVRDDVPVVQAYPHARPGGGL